MSIGVHPPPNPLMIRFLLIPVLGDTREFLRPKPRDARVYLWLQENIGKNFDEGFEHVAVLYNGQRRDMFAGETSSINGRHIRNVRATEIYRANTVRQMPPSFNPEELPAISGPAVLFPDEIVWK